MRRRRKLPRPFYDIEVTLEQGVFVARVYFHGSRNVALIAERDGSESAAVERVLERLREVDRERQAPPLLRTLHADVRGSLLPLDKEKGERLGSPVR